MQAAFPKVTESQRCLTTYLTSLDDQRPMLMVWGIHSGMLLLLLSRFSYV